MTELTEGFKRFAANADQEFYSGLVKGQQPHTLMISCSDSRIIPEQIFDAKPGEIFVLRNVGNLARIEESSVQSCIDYAVKHLGVKRIAVLGHNQCGAVKATEHKAHLDTDGLREWLKQEEFDGENLVCAEKAHAIRQLNKILAYPIVKKEVADGKLEVCTLYFSMNPVSMEIYEEGGWHLL